MRSPLLPVIFFLAFEGLGAFGLPPVQHVQVFLHGLLKILC
jgi:hypothetical protein